ncbi:MAG: hypothetical protein U1E65_32045 [Myxococcota bacterium]
MRRPTTIRSLPLFALTLALGCGSSTEAPDAGPTGMDATAASDGGVRAFCPMLAAPACTRANACGTMDNNPSQATCVACKKTNTSLCTFGACSMPDLLSAGDPYNISFDIVDVQRVQSFHQVVIAAESSGGLVRTCADVAVASFDVGDPCNNVLDSRLRTRNDINPAGTVVTLTHTRFASGIRAIFLVYGYESNDTSGAAIGVACAEVDVDAPGSGVHMVNGGTMHAL